MKLFISYSHSNKVTANLIASSLSRYYDVWLDRDDLKPGVDWQQSITRSIKASDVVLFLASPSSLASRYCEIEIEEALKLKKTIIPIMLDNLVLRPELARLQWILLLKSEDFDKAMLELLGGLQGYEANNLHWKIICSVEAIIILLYTLAYFLP